jgi:hypothetical protein
LVRKAAKGAGGMAPTAARNIKNKFGCVSEGSSLFDLAALTEAECDTLQFPRSYALSQKLCQKRPGCRLPNVAKIRCFNAARE